VKTQIRNPKFEIRNPKQIRMTEIRMFKTKTQLRRQRFEHSNFVLVSDFVLRISDFLLQR